MLMLSVAAVMKASEEYPVASSTVAQATENQNESDITTKYKYPQIAFTMILKNSFSQALANHEKFLHIFLQQSNLSQKCQTMETMQYNK